VQVKPVETSEQTEQFIEFGIVREHYALNIQEVQEIIKIQEITVVPNAAPYLKGVINLRGKIVPVISLSHLFNQVEEEITYLSRIIVVNYQGEAVGIMVDRVNKVTHFTDIQPNPDRVGGISGSYFSGIGLSVEGLVGILKLDELLLIA
jgi:purine-binding chemotaxis protein CheW